MRMVSDLHDRTGIHQGSFLLKGLQYSICGLLGLRGLDRIGDGLP